MVDAGLSAAAGRYRLERLLDGLRRRTAWFPLPPLDCESPPERDPDELPWYPPPDEFGLRRRLPLVEPPFDRRDPLLRWAPPA